MLVPTVLETKWKKKKKKLVFRSKILRQRNCFFSWMGREEGGEGYIYVIYYTMWETGEDE